MWIKEERFRQMEEALSELNKFKRMQRSNYRNIEISLNGLLINSFTKDSEEYKRIKAIANLFDVHKEAVIDEEEIGTLTGRTIIVGSGEAKIKKTYTLKEEALPKGMKEDIEQLQRVASLQGKVSVNSHGEIKDNRERIEDLEDDVFPWDNDDDEGMEDDTLCYQAGWDDGFLAGQDAKTKKKTK